VTTERIDVVRPLEPSGGEVLDPGREHRSIMIAASALIVGQAALRLTTFLEGFYSVDDFVYVYRAEQGLGGAYLLQDYNGHLQPGQFLLVWLLQTLSPMDYGLVAVVLVALQLATSIVVWSLIKEFVGVRVGALVPLVVYLFSPLTLPAFQWYAAALQAVPLQLATAACLLFHRRHLRSGRRSDAVGAVASLIAGLWFWEKALVIVPVLVAVSLLWPSPAGVVDNLRRQRRLWVAYVAVSGVYLAIYLQLTGAPVDGDNAVPVWSFLREIVFHSFVPALFGGSYTGDQIDARLIGTEPTALHTGFLVLFVALVAVTLASDRRAWRAWAFLAAYLGGSALLLAAGRGANGAWFGRATRFIADASVPATLAVAIALMPALGRRPGVVERVLDRTSVVAMVCVVYLTSCLVTTAAVAQRSADISTERFVRIVESEFRRTGDVVVYDGRPPDLILTPLVLQDQRFSRVLGGLDNPPRFDEPTDVLYEIDLSGRLVPARLRSVSVDLAPPAPCAWSATATAAGTVPLGGELMPWRWVVVMSVTSDAATDAVVEIGGTEYSASIPVGTSDLWVVHDGPVGDVRVAAEDATACVTRLQVGQIEA
jgi:hypothetical protein